MNYTDFANTMLIALYQEAEDKGTQVTFKEVTERYGLPQNLRWIEKLTNEWEANGWVDVDSYIGSPLGWHAEISGYGMREVEDRYGTKDGVGTILQPVANDALDDPAIPDGDSSPDPIDSSGWTGLPATFVLSEEKRAKLVACLQDVESQLDEIGAGNSEKAQARAYIVAARALADAPDPPADLIWELVQRANSIAGIAALFVSIIALFA